MHSIAVVTTGRADFGLLTPLVTALQLRPNLTCEVLIAKCLQNECSSLVGQGGLHSRNVHLVDLDITGSTPMDKAIELSRAIKIFAHLIERLNPDVIVVLGDRFEIFGAVQSAFLMRKRIAHISGGERTKGSIDDEFRKCISLLSNVHLVSRSDHKSNLIDLGIPPEDIHVVGYLGSDVLLDLRKLNYTELQDQLDFESNLEKLVVTYHPNSRDPSQTPAELAQLIQALDQLSEYAILITGANDDAGGTYVNETLRSWCSQNSDRARFYKQLGSNLYLNVALRARAVVGNSSSGLTEIPLMGVNAVNLGDRQEGRIPLGSVIQCPFDSNEIVRVLRELPQSPSQSRAAKVSERTSNRISDILEGYLDKWNTE